jgi:hypothetical protein
MSGQYTIYTWTSKYGGIDISQAQESKETVPNFVPTVFKKTSLRLTIR